MIFLKELQIRLSKEFISPKFDKNYKLIFEKNKTNLFEGWDAYLIPISKTIIAKIYKNIPRNLIKNELSSEEKAKKEQTLSLLAIKNNINTPFIHSILKVNINVTINDNKLNGEHWISFMDFIDGPDLSKLPEPFISIAMKLRKIEINKVNSIGYTVNTDGKTLKNAIYDVEHNKVYLIDLIEWKKT